ncbi:MAG: methionyl-tRNA formyltransferase [Pseudomonadota bacterium]
MTLRIVFMGAPDFAVPSLRAIANAGHEIAAVYTQPPRPAGRRGLSELPTPVHKAALELGLTVRTPEKLKSTEDQDALSALNADVGVVVAYGLLLPAPILEAPKHGCLNFHPSDLPRWRGAAPIQRTIMAGDASTAACVMRMDIGLDTGPVCLREPFDIPSGMTAGALHDVMSERGALMLVRALEMLANSTLRCMPQTDDGATYAAKIDKAEARIDWTQPAAAVAAHVNGLSPFPGAWFAVGETGSTKTSTDRVKVFTATSGEASSSPAAPGTVCAGDDNLTVRCGDGGTVTLGDVQRAGKKRVTAEEFRRGAELREGMRLPI